VNGFPSPESIPVDGLVGTLADNPVGPSLGRVEPQLRVVISGDGVGGPVAMGLAEDVEVLITGFIRRSAAATPATSHSAVPSHESDDDSDDSDDSEISLSLHGLGLDADAERDLRRRVLAMVRNRLASEESSS
jgi:hypothetical protein